MAGHKKHIGLGIVMALSFWVVLFLMFSNIFPQTKEGKAQNGLEWADEMFNQLAKGSSYFIPKVAKSNEKFVVKAGAMANVVMSAKDVATLASMPSRDELLAKLLGTMQAPIAQFVRTLNEVPTKFVRGLAAVRDKQAA